MIGTIVGIVVLVLIVVALAVSRRSPVGGPIQLSHLKCPKCGIEFDYAYLPGASFTSIRLGGSRFLRCRTSTSGLFSTFGKPGSTPKPITAN
jgi:prepilin signal peptidase PulO-like enzyme (type II secretory pathway)